MKPARRFRDWARQQDRLASAVSRLTRATRRAGEAEDVHQLRVAVRRLRLLVRLGAPWHPKQISRRFREWSQAVSRATDPLRDLDVALEKIQDQPAAQAVLDALRTRRSRVWRQQRRRLEPLPRSLQRGLSQPEGGRHAPARLARRCARLQRKLRDRVRTDTRRFFTLPEPDRHDFRRVVRRWRYLRELDLHPADQAHDPLLRRLLQLQEALGERQNLLIAERTIAALPRSDLGQSLLASLQAERLHWEARIRRALRGWGRVR